MTLITDLTLRADASVDGTEEYVVNVAGVDYKVRGSGITKIVSDALAAYISSNDIVVTTLGTDKADLTGDTYTGFVTLHADPIAALNAATKQYVDTEVGTKLDAIGGTLDATATGTTSADIDETTAVATNAYVASKIKYEILKKTLINAAVHNAVEADKGRLQVIYASNPVTINLPLISGLADRERVEYLIFDGRNDAENNPITINTNVADAFIDASTSKIINTDGESIHIAASGANQWAVLDKDATATETAEGITRKATSAEAILLAETNAYITPATTKAILEDTVYKNNDIGAASKVFASTDRGNWYVTYTSLGIVNLTLPDPLTLDNTVTYRVTDKGNATVNAITFTTLGGTINGVSGFTINKTGLGAEFFHDGTNWFTMNDVQTAVEIAGLESTTVIAYGAGAGAIPITATRVDYTSVGAFEALTLIDGTVGQKLKIVHVVDGGSGILTPTSLLGYTTITFNDQGDSVELQYGTGGWAIISVFNATIA